MWFNQVPVAAGLVATEDGSNAFGGKYCIDLVCRKSKGTYDFIELKFACLEAGGDTPLCAAIEILKYCAAYLFVIAHQGELESRGYAPKITDAYLNDGQELETKSKRIIATATELLEATDVTLCVLGPTNFYAKFGFLVTWLSTEINRGLDSFIASHRIGRLKSLRFRFESFESDNLFQSVGENGFKFNLTRHLVTAASSEAKNA